MKEKLEEIRKIEDKYGLLLFGMGLTHLVDVGHRTLDVPFIEESIKQILSAGEADSGDGSPIMSPGFQCNIVRCAAELSGFSIWTLFGYIKKYMEVGGL